MKLTIKRKEWLHGEGTAKSFLLRPSDEKKCCLGILAIACGVSPATLRGYRTPSDLLRSKRVSVPLPEDCQWTVDLRGGAAEARSTGAAGDAMRVNDITIGDAVGTEPPILSEEQREYIIAKIFKQHGIDVQFED